MAVNHSTRRAALGTILAAPLASVPAVATGRAETVSPDLLRIVTRCERLHAHLRRFTDDDVFPNPCSKACGKARAQVANYPTTGWLDLMVKVRCLGRVYDDFAHEAASARGQEHAYIDDLVLAIVFDLHQLAMNTPQA